MNHSLAYLATSSNLDAPTREPLRLAFGLACASRVQHLLEDPQAIECLGHLQAYVDGTADRAALDQARKVIAKVANSHRGSNSIDGTAHAAVSATYAVANALAGRALDAASYAAYATVYAYGGYAVNDPQSFEAEFAWQVERFRELAGLDTNAAVTSA
jgi:hypothetical protein